MKFGCRNCIEKKNRVYSFSGHSLCQNTRLYTLHVMIFDFKIIQYHIVLIFMANIIILRVEVVL